LQLGNEFENKRKALGRLGGEALVLQHFECYEEEKNYKEILQVIKSARRFVNLLYYTTNRYQQALDMLLRSLELANKSSTLRMGLVQKLVIFTKR